MGRVAQRWGCLIARQAELEDGSSRIGIGQGKVEGQRKGGR